MNLRCDRGVVRKRGSHSSLITLDFPRSVSVERATLLAFVA